LKKEGVGLITYEESEVDQIEGIGTREAEKVHSLSSALIVVF
jgi:hypothetical protein